jgi:hypothetical protein
MRISSLMLALCASALLITGGCAKNQMAAKKSVDKIEESLKDVRADAERYAPEGLKSIDSQVARFKADIDAKNYDDVVAGTPSLEKAVDSLKDAVALGKKHAAQALEVAKTEWTALSEEVPKMVETIDKRVAELDKKKMFRGIKKEDFESAKATFASMKSTWAEASTDHSAGKPVAATTKAKSAKSMGDQLYETLDIKKT